MILEELTVRNWRGYRSEHTFRFQDGINLIVGRNEAGKSTLFEVLTRVMFDRFNSRTEEIRAMQPIGSSLGPEASVVFRTDEGRYRIKKRFLHEPSSELYTERRGKWELDHTGDQADANVRTILGGEVASRTAAKPEHRGIAQALWYLQSDGPVPDGTWNDVVKQGIQGMVRQAIRTPAENSFMEKLETEYRKYWTPTGVEYARSELIDVRSRVYSLEKTLSDLKAAERTVALYRTDMEELLEQRSVKISSRQEAEKDLLNLSALIDEAEDYESNCKELREDVKTLERGLNECMEHMSAVSTGQKENDELREAIRLDEEALTRKTVELNIARSEAENREFSLRNTLSPRIDSIESQRRALQAAGDLRKLEKDRERLQKHVDSLKSGAADIEAMRLERLKFISPDNRELARFNRIYEEFLTLNAQIEASAVRVNFKWEHGPVRVTTFPQAKSTQEDEFLVQEPTEFRIPGMGTIVVKSGTQELKETVAKAGTLKKKIDETLSSFCAENRDALISLNEKGRDMDRIIAAADERLQEMRNSIQDPEEELARTIRGINEERAIASSFPLRPEDNRGSVIRELIRQKETEKDRVKEDVSRERLLEKSARKRSDEIQDELRSITGRLSDMRARVQKNDSSIAGVLKKYGTFEHLAEHISSLKQDLSGKKAHLQVIEETYDQKVTRPRRLYSETEASVNALKQQISDVDREISRKSAVIEHEVNSDNYAQTADIEIELSQLNRRLEVLKKRADAAKLLTLLVTEYERRRSTILSGPVRETITPWLRFLTDGTYETIHVDDAMKPSSLSAAGYNTDVPVSSLSHGTREQVMVLMRLAMGVIMSSETRNLIVIDDRLVNADAVRVKRLCSIIEEASRHCQILMATCNDTPYASLPAKTIRVPSDGFAGG